MATARWNGEIIAESDKTETVEGNLYFPLESLNPKFLKPSATTTACSWKGTANYYTLSVNGKENPDAVWYYDNPTDAAANIKGHAAFWNGVEVSP